MDIFLVFKRMFFWIYFWSLKKIEKLRILVGMHDLCKKIDWEQTRVLENGQTVATGCEVKPFIWNMLLTLVLMSIGGQVGLK